MSAGPTTKERVLEVLRTVRYPGFSRDIVSFGIVKDVQVEGGRATLSFDLPADKPETMARVEETAREALSKLPGLTGIAFRKTAKAAPPPKDPWRERAPIPGVKHLVAVASGKGGVGKTTVAVNLALALAHEGHAVGLLDLDIYGPNVPLMMGTSARPGLADGKLVPPERFGIRVMSLGLLLTDKSPVIWRGPLVAQAVRQLLHEVAWGTLDYLVIDLPPGTGDAQLSLVQDVPLSGAVIVTTPSDVALLDAEKGLRMFDQVGVAVLGIVENMSYFVCPHCRAESDVFSRGGGRRVSEALGAPFLGEVPLHPRIREGGDGGTPIIISAPESPEAQAFLAIARQVLAAFESRWPALSVTAA